MAQWLKHLLLECGKLSFYLTKSCKVWTQRLTICGSVATELRRRDRWILEAAYMVA